MFGRETLSHLPKKHPARMAVAEQLCETRGYERDDSPLHGPRDRSGERYIRYLTGLSHLFDYVRRLPKRSILDIGAGTTRGIREVSELAAARDLEFSATVLSPVKAVHRGMGKVRVHTTPGEILRGIRDESVGSALSVHGISYSAVPRFAVRSVDRVLVPGGVIKMIDPFLEFATHFHELGYDTAITNNGFTPVLLGIKPDSQKTVTAQSLAEADLLSCA